MTDDEPKIKWRDILDLRLPIITIIAMTGFFMWITYIVLSTMNKIEIREARIEHAIEEMRRTDIRLERTINEALEKYERTLQKDRELWCLKAQRANPNWKCPEFIRRDYLND